MLHDVAAAGKRSPPVPGAGRVLARVRHVVALALLLCAPAAAVASPGLPPGGPPILHAPAPDVPELRHDGPFRAAPLLVSGTDALRRGEYVHQDHLLDDRGADTMPVGNAARTDKPNPASTGDIAASPAGDVRYATDPRFAGNAADLAELRIRATDEHVVLRATLRTAVAEDAAVLGVGFDLDGSGGAAVPWPLGAGIATPGLDAFVTAWGTGAELRRLPGGEPVALPVDVDLERNQVTVRVPRAALPLGAWDVVAGAGLWDRQARAWLTPSTGTTPTAERPASGSPVRGAPAVLDLAFGFAETFVKAPDGQSTTFPGQGNWLDEAQAKALAGGTTGGFVAEVDLRGEDGWRHAPGRVQARVLGSRLQVHEGVRAAHPEYGSRLQPYLLVVPEGIGTERAPAGLTFALHSFGGTYTQNAVFSPELHRRLGDERGSVVVTPLARSLGGGYATESEADVFEVWADVARHVVLDPSRVAITGYSMGGFGTGRLVAAYPDLFGAAFTGVGPGIAPQGAEQNARWVPFLNWVAVGDELVTYASARAAHDRMVAAGLRTQLWSFAGEHFTLAIQDEWGEAAAFLGDARRTEDPWRVTYAFSPADDRRDLGLARDGAYWVSGVVPADRARQARVDARSLASGRRDAPLTAVTAAKAGANLYPAPVRLGDGVPTPPLRIEGQAWGPAPAAAPEDALELDLTNVSALRIDVGGAGLRRPEVRVTSDVPVVVDLGGGRRCEAPAGTTRC
jgi:dienelactone hydrolase